MTTFEEWYAELEAEAVAEGPSGVTELEYYGIQHSLSSQVRERREELSLTQRQLAEQSGLTLAQVKDIEAGDGTSLALLAAIVRPLGVELQLVPRPR